MVAWGDNGYQQTSIPAGAQQDVIAISAGDAHALALKSNGSVIAWGAYGQDFGQAQVPAEAKSGVRAIAAGRYHSLALKSDGSVIAWGYGSQTNVPATARSGVVAIGAMDYSSVALKADGSVVFWDRTTIIANTALEHDIISMAAGGSQFLALRSDHSILHLGDNVHGQAAIPEVARNHVAVTATGLTQAMVITEDGQVINWGDGSNPVPAEAGNGVTAVAAGYGHAVALKGDGSVVTWGMYDQEQATVPPFARSGVTAIAANQNYTLALLVPPVPVITGPPTNQAVSVGQPVLLGATAEGLYLTYQWRKDGVDISGATNATYSLGLAQSSQAGNYTVVASNAGGSVTSAPPTVVSVAPPAGTVVAWGANTYGQTNVPVSAQSGVTAIAAGDSHMVALKADGSVVAWGNNPYGQTIVPPDAQGGVTAIAAGDSHTLALKADGSVLTWGGAARQLTNVPAAARSGVVAIAAGQSHSVALRSDGSVLAWGSNAVGETNVPAAAQSNVVAIAAAGRWAAALKTDGSLVVWGEKPFGVTNGPTGTNRIIALTASPYNLVALRADGSVTVQGYGLNGDLRVPLSLKSRVSAVAAGPEQIIGLKEDGTIAAWERPGYQQRMPIGLGSVTAVTAGNRFNAALVGPAVSLQPLLTPNGLILSWPANAAGYTLQVATNLTPPVIWAGVSNSPPVSAGAYTVTNKPDGPSRFFRLHK